MCWVILRFIREIDITIKVNKKEYDKRNMKFLISFAQNALINTLFRIHTSILQYVLRKVCDCIVYCECRQCLSQSILHTTKTIQKLTKVS